MNIRIKNSKSVQFILITTSLIMLVYVAGLGFYNNLQYDDWVFYKRVTNSNVFEFVSHMYMTWQGRYSSFLVSGFFFFLISKLNSVFFITIIQLFIGIASTLLLLKHFFKTINVILLVASSVFLVTASIMGLFELASFYWVCSSIYTTFVFLTLFLVWLIISENNTLITYSVILIVSILIGGSAEIYSPLIILIFLSYFVYKNLFYFKIKFIWNKENSKLLFSIIIISISFIVLLIAPGNINRMNNPGTNIHPFGLELLLKTFRTMFDFLIIFFSKIFYYVLPFFVFVYLTKSNSDKDTKHTISKDVLFRFIKSFMMILCLFFISVLLGVYAVNQLMPLRAFSYVSVVITAFFSYWGYVIGKNYKIPFSASHSLIIICFFMSIITSYYIYVDFPKTKKYNVELNNRIFLLKELKKKNFKGIAVVKPINVETTQSSQTILWNFIMEYYKPSKKNNILYFPYYILELSEDKNYWVNRELKSYLDLDFDVVGDVSNRKSIL